MRRGELSGNPWDRVYGAIVFLVNPLLACVVSIGGIAQIVSLKPPGQRVTSIR